MVKNKESLYQIILILAIVAALGTVYWFASWDYGPVSLVEPIPNTEIIESITVYNKGESFKLTPNREEFNQRGALLI